MAPTDRKTLGPKDDPETHPVVRALGRTRVELVPRDSRSVFVYWEVADPEASGSDSPQSEYVIELRRERDGEVVATHRSAERLRGEVIEVDQGGRYWAALNLSTADGLLRLARSTTSAGPLPSDEPARFVELTPGDGGLSLEPSEHEAPGPIDWTARPTDASSR